MCVARMVGSLARGLCFATLERYGRISLELANRVNFKVFDERIVRTCFRFVCEFYFLLLRRSHRSVVRTSARLYIAPTRASSRGTAYPDLRARRTRAFRRILATVRTADHLCVSVLLTVVSESTTVSRFLFFTCDTLASERVRAFIK